MNFIFAQFRNMISTKNDTSKTIKIHNEIMKLSDCVYLKGVLKNKYNKHVR